MSFDFASLASLGVNTASGNYVGAGIQGVGLAMSLFGGISSMNNAKQQAEVSGDIAKQEQAINAQKRDAMELNARRQQMETLRNTQRARAQAVQNATTQGANLGSGLQGGLAEASSQGLFNLVGINSALMTGRNIADLNDKISADKMQLASLGGDAATSQGIMSMGGSLMKAGPTLGSLSGGFNFGSLFGGGNYSGTPGASNTGGLY